MKSVRQTTENTIDSSCIESMKDCQECLQNNKTTSHQVKKQEQTVYTQIPSFQLPIERVKPQVFCIVGSPATGKSSFVRAIAPQCYTRSVEDYFWHDYNGESDILFENFEGTKDWSEFIGILEGSQEKVERVERKVKMNAKRVFITSKKEYYEWFEEGNTTSKRNRRELNNKIRKLINHYIHTTPSLLITTADRTNRDCGQQIHASAPPRDAAIQCWIANVSVDKGTQ